MSSTDGTIPNPINEDELKERSSFPRVTEAEVLGSISKKEFLVVDGGTLTICVLTLKNGWQVTGESACAHIANYKQDIGERIAYDNAVKQIWKFLGYVLRDKLHNEPKDFMERLEREHSELQDRLTKLIDFIDNSPAYNGIDEKQQHWLTDQRDLMQRYLAILAQRLDHLTSQN